MFYNVKVWRIWIIFWIPYIFGDVLQASRKLRGTNYIKNANINKFMTCRRFSGTPLLCCRSPCSMLLSLFLLVTWYSSWQTKWRMAGDGKWKLLEHPPPPTLHSTPTIPLKRLELIIHAMSLAMGGKEMGPARVGTTLFNIYEHNRFSNYN